MARTASVGCPTRLPSQTDSQIVDGKCPDRPTLELRWLEEQNYFFEEFLADGYRTVAADAFADTALIAARAGLAEAEPLADRAHALYHACGARPLLADPLDEVAAVSRGR